MSYSEINNGSDDLLSQKILERSNMDKFMTHQQIAGAPGVAPIAPIAPVVSSMIIQKFLSFTPDEKRRLSINNPDMYQKIISVLNTQQMPPQIQSVQPVQSVQSVQSVQPVQSVQSVQPVQSVQAVQPPPDFMTGSVEFPKLYNDTHSSDDDDTLSSQVEILKKKKKNKTNFLSFDFRCDIKDIHKHKYSLIMPTKYSKNIIHLELESCIIHHIANLDKESYIYIKIEEFDGDYVTSSRKVFGKLLMAKKTASFISYLPENCKKTFLTPVSLSYLTISFYNYDNTPILLHTLQLKSLVNDVGNTAITTTDQHFLSPGDRLTLNNNYGNKITSEILTVKEIADKFTCIVNSPVMPLDKNTSRLDATLEKIDLKCTLTFKITSDEA
jgi:hypothetical protein